MQILQLLCLRPHCLNHFGHAVAKTRDPDSRGGVQVASATLVDQLNTFTSHKDWSAKFKIRTDEVVWQGPLVCCGPRTRPAKGVTVPAAAGLGKVHSWLVVHRICRHVAFNPHLTS